MTVLNQLTRLRLQKLPQIASVWEGDRRSMVAGLQAAMGSPEADAEGDCVMWVDGSMGMVRAMEVVGAGAGPEAIARTLLRAMEYPHQPAIPARPQKIVVRDREILFFLRGVLQDLGINLDYVPKLPLIDEIFRSFQEFAAAQPPQIPEQFQELLEDQALQLWELAPWEYLEDHEILAIEINQWDVGTLYVSVMGMLGMEYGLLLYRSLDSLKQFRQRALAPASMEEMEQAFLSQDCLFITFEREEEEMEVDEFGFVEDPFGDSFAPVFGNLHPLEGLRPFLHREEAAVLSLSLAALGRFCHKHAAKLTPGDFPALTSRHTIALPDGIEGPKSLAIKVSTLPDLAEDLLAMGDIEDAKRGGTLVPILRDDLVPDKSFLSLGVVPWEMLDYLRAGAEYYQSQDVVNAGDGLPVVMIQTSRPKAKAMIESLRQSGGLKGICFNPGEDPLEGDRYDLGLLKMGNGELQLFGEFGEDDPTHVAARKKWDQRCQKTKGYCGLVIAKGLTGASRGNPQFKDMMALFETQAMNAKDLDMGTLKLVMGGES
jgi:hypothetical protein